MQLLLEWRDQNRHLRFTDFAFDRLIQLSELLLISIQYQFRQQIELINGILTENLRSGRSLCLIPRISINARQVRYQVLAYRTESFYPH